MIQKVAGLVLGVALAFGAGAMAGVDTQDRGSGPTPPACCQKADGNQADHAAGCCAKDGRCCAECGDCAKGECKNCKTADCCKDKACCKDGHCAMQKKDGDASSACCNGR